MSTVGLIVLGVLIFAAFLTAAIAITYREKP